MEIAELLNDKTLKPKVKTETICAWLIDHKIDLDELIVFADTAKDPAKATCIEAFEFATKQNPSVATKKCFEFVTKNLKAKAPRVKWESAKVISNIAYLFADNLEEVIVNLLENTEHEGTVVRWSAATALGEIVKLNTKQNKHLLPAIEVICNREEKNSIKKIYLDAIKKTVNQKILKMKKE